MAETTTAVATVDRAAVARLDELARKAVAVSQETSPFSRAIGMAEVMGGLRESLAAKGVLDGILRLQGSAVGFRSDKTYDALTIRDAVIEATCLGLAPCGNQFNVIAGRAYVTKEGFGTLLKQLPGLTYSIVPGVPRMAAGGAVVPVAVRWTYQGRSGEQSLDLAVRINAGGGADMATGKATRKARAWLYGYLTGSEMPEGDVSDAAGPVIDTTARVSPFESRPAPAPAEPAAATVSESSVPNWDHASPEDIEDEIARLAQDSGVTTEALDAWALGKHGKPFLELPTAMKRSMARNPAAFIATVKATGKGVAS